MSKTIEKFTTSDGNKLEFYTVEHLPNTIIVADHSCQLERQYTIGSRRALSFFDYENGLTLIESFKQVIDAWTNEKIHF